MISARHTTMLARAAVSHCHLDRAGDHNGSVRAITSSPDEAEALVSLGRDAQAAGDAAQGGILMQQALDIFQRIGAAEALDLLAEQDSPAGPRPSHKAGASHRHTTARSARQ
jgi:hypothetical protein